MTQLRETVAAARWPLARGPRLASGARSRSRDSASVGTPTSSCSPSSTVRRNAAQTASDRTVRSRPDSSSWSAAALVPPGEVTMFRSCGRVHARLLREERAALERLDHQVVGDVAREAEVDRRVDQRLHHQEDVGRAGARDRGGHRDEPLVVDLDLRAERARGASPACSRCVRGGLGRRVPDGHAAPELGGRVGHAPDHLAMAEVADQRARRRAGEDADHELARLESTSNLAPDPGQHLGLDREQDDVGALDRRGVRVDRADAVGARRAPRADRRAGARRRSGRARRARRGAGRR